MNQACPDRRMTPFKRSVITLVALVFLAACATPTAPPTTTLSAEPSDAAMNANHQGYARQQAAIQALNNSGKHPLKGYSLSKAQCWLDVSVHEYSRNDRSRFPQEALEQSKGITHYLQTGQEADAQNPAHQTPLVNQAEKLRDDLWIQAKNLKADGGDCAQPSVACAEVELVHAGNEYRQQGWRHAKPYIQIAEDKLAQAQLAQAECQKKPEPVHKPPAVEAMPTVTTHKVVLSASALFKFDKSRPADLLPEGRAQLDALARMLSEVYAKVERIELVGYTDRLGADGYNQRLSEARASTVQSYLQSKGVQAPMSAKGKGKANPVSQGCMGDKPITALRACLQPDRRVELVIVGAKH
jgi:OmpA-OmpF porin, OOP family